MRPLPLSLKPKSWFLIDPDTRFWHFKLCSAGELWTSIFCPIINHVSVWRQVEFLEDWKIHSQMWRKKKVFQSMFGNNLQQVYKSDSFCICPAANHNGQRYEWSQTVLEAWLIQRNIHYLKLCFLIFTQCSMTVQCHSREFFPTSVAFSSQIFFLCIWVWCDLYMHHSEEDGGSLSKGIVQL